MVDPLYGGIFNQCIGSMAISHRMKFEWLLICSDNSSLEIQRAGCVLHKRLRAGKKVCLSLMDICSQVLKGPKLVSWKLSNNKVSWDYFFKFLLLLFEHAEIKKNMTIRNTWLDLFGFLLEIGWLFDWDLANNKAILEENL